MPRRGENIYKRKDGRWEGRVLKPEGKYQYVYARTYREVKEKKKDLQDRVKARSANNIRFVCNSAELFETWLNGGLADRVKPSTYESYYRCITKYVIPFFQKHGDNRITEQAAAEFAGRISSNTELSGAYKRKILSIFKTALREIMKGAYESVLNEISLPKAMSTNVQIFSVKEQRLIEKTLIEFQDKSALGILLCFYTGIRLGEICALKWVDIDFDAGTMIITRTVSRIKNFNDTGNKTILSVGMPKSQKSVRKIPLPQFVLDLIRKYKIYAVDENNYILSGTKTPIDPRSYQKLFQKVLKKAGVKSRKFHAIRHTFATRALELGVDIKTLSEILGHANVSVTLNIYAHSMFEQKKKAIDKMNAMYVLHEESASFAVLNSVANA